jgi:hypothetical protein
MVLTDGILVAARELGKALREDAYLRAYRGACQAVQDDPEASDLEKQTSDAYEELIAREQADAAPMPHELQPFYELRRQRLAHPLIAKRGHAMRLVRPHLAEIAEEISLQLGMDYTALAAAAQPVSAYSCSTEGGKILCQKAN